MYVLQEIWTRHRKVYNSKKYGRSCTYCQNKGHGGKLFWKKQNYDEEKEKENMDEEIVHDEIFFGDGALSQENKTTKRKCNHPEN